VVLCTEGITVRDVFCKESFGEYFPCKISTAMNVIVVAMSGLKILFNHAMETFSYFGVFY